MNILILYGSPRKGGNTELLAEAFAKGAAEKQHHVEIVSVRDFKVNPCLGCNACFKSEDNNKNPQGLYATQASLMKEKLDAVGTPTEILSGYSSGHAVPQTTETLQVMYDFLTTHIPVSPDTRIDRAIVNHAQPSIPDATYNLMGSRVGPSYKGLVIRSGRQVVVR